MLIDYYRHVHLQSAHISLLFLLRPHVQTERSTTILTKETSININVTIHFRPYWTLLRWTVSCESPASGRVTTVSNTFNKMNDAAWITFFCPVAALTSASLAETNKRPACRCIQRLPAGSDSAPPASCQSGDVSHDPSEWLIRDYYPISALLGGCCAFVLAIIGITTWTTSCLLMGPEHEN